MVLAKSWITNNPEKEKSRRDKIKNSKCGKHTSTKTEFKKGHGFSKEEKQKMKSAKLGKARPEIKKWLGEYQFKEGHKGYWKDKHFSEEHLQKILSRLKERPTSLEVQFIDLCKKHTLPFLYCGDGSLIIGYKNPDFVESNGKKICLEVANRFHHQGNWGEKRIEHFAKYGWKCIVVFEEEFEDKNKLLEKVMKGLTNT